MDDRSKCACTGTRTEAPPSAPPAESDVLAHLDEVWRLHGREVLERCVSWSGGRAEDAREAFSRAWSRAAASLITNGPRPNDPLGWLLTIAYRTCMDLHRERSRRGEQELDAATPAYESPLRLSSTPEDPERVALNKELRAFLLREVERLPPRLRETMRTYMRSSSYRDVVERFGITEANARKRIQQARAILRERLGDYRRGRMPRRRR